MTLSSPNIFLHMASFFQGITLLTVLLLAYVFAKRIRDPLVKIPRINDGDAERTADLTVPGLKHKQWIAENKSNVLAYRYGLAELRLFVADSKAANWILGSNGYRYGPAPINEKFVPLLLGDGLLSARGDVHKRQRRAINPAFAPMHLKALVPTFVELAERMVARIEQQPRGDNGKVVEMQRHLTAVTLDIIGQTSFDYDFGALTTGTETASPLSAAFHAAMQSMSITTQNWFERLLLSPTAISFVPSLYSSLLIRRNRLIAAATKEMERISLDILDTKKEQILNQSRGTQASKNDDGLDGNDLLHILLRANMPSDIPASRRLDDSELVGQATTFIFAGHETTSTAMAHTLRLLSEHPDVQAKLQAELDGFHHSLGTAKPTWDTISALSYLSKVVDEVRRCAPPATSVRRTALHDDVIPLSRPIPDASGNPASHTHVHVRKGTVVTIGLRAINQDPIIWGDDADQFNPDRWDHLPRSYYEANIPGRSWTFSGGVKTCIGMRFAVMELKVLICTVLRKWRLEPVERIKEAQYLVVYPVVVGKEEEGGQIPVRLVDRELEQSADQQHL